MSSGPRIDVVGLGLNATDTVIRVPRVEAGTKVPIDSVETLPGGPVATAIIACAKWGLGTRYVGNVGDDQAAAVHRREFDRFGVETQLLTRPGCASQQAFILIEPSGERTVLWKRDPRLALRPEELDRDFIAAARVLHVDGHDTAAAATAAAWARAAGMSVVADLDDLYPGIEALLPHVDFLIASRDIPARLTQRSELRESLPAVRERFGCRLVAATLGAQGVLAWEGSEFHYCAAYHVPVIDTTGAGDLFHAGFIYALLESWTIERSFHFACAAAALNCTGVGARGAIPTIPEIESLVSRGMRHDSVFP